MRDVAIDRIMTTEPATVGPHEHISAAQRLFETTEIHHLPVVEDGKLVGIVSSSDLLKFHLLDGDPADVSGATVRNVMEADPVILNSGASLRDAAATLSVGGYHALPIVEGDGTLIGIVTTVDLVKHLLQHIGREDGSIREAPEAGDAAELSDGDLSQVLRRAEEAERDGADNDGFARALFTLRNRNRRLEGVRKAAELYMRSGHGEREHGVLVKSLADLQ